MGNRTQAGAASGSIFNVKMPECSLANDGEVCESKYSSKVGKVMFEGS
jgi:hypothetical protein